MKNTDYRYFHAIRVLEEEVRNFQALIQSEKMGQVAKILINDTSPMEEVHKNNINKFQEKIDEINGAIILLKKY